MGAEDVCGSFRPLRSPAFKLWCHGACLCLTSYGMYIPYTNIQNSHMIVMVMMQNIFGIFPFFETGNFNLIIF